MKNRLQSMLYVEVNAKRLIYKKVGLNQKHDFISKLRMVLIKRKLFYKFHIIIGDNCIIGDGLEIPHPQNIVIGNYVIIGKNCRILQDVTIGLKVASGVGTAFNYPVINDNCILCSGSKILGDIQLGNATIVAANSVLTNSTKVNSIYAGVPAIFKKFREE